MTAPRSALGTRFATTTAPVIRTRGELLRITTPATPPHALAWLFVGCKAVSRALRALAWLVVASTLTLLLSFCMRSKCDCEDEWTGDDCAKTNYQAAKAIPIDGTPMDLTTDPDVLEACRLTADAANGACFDYALSYKYVCSRVSAPAAASVLRALPLLGSLYERTHARAFPPCPLSPPTTTTTTCWSIARVPLRVHACSSQFVTAINDLKLYKDCKMSSLERHLDTCTKDKNIGHFAACPKMCAAIIHAWCNKALADRLQTERDVE